jgi:hypothetical protein
MIVGRHQVMLFSNRFAMSQPSRRNVGGECFPKIRRASGPEILEQFRPSSKSRLLDDPFKLGSQVRITAPISSDMRCYTGRFCWPSMTLMEGLTPMQTLFRAY